jgi:hypothetical protein
VSVAITAIGREIGEEFVEYRELDRLDEVPVEAGGACGE